MAVVVIELFVVQIQYADGDRLMLLIQLCQHLVKALGQKPASIEGAGQVIVAMYSIWRSRVLRVAMMLLAGRVRLTS